MKLKLPFHALAIGAFLCATVACDRNHKNIDDIADPTPGDSLMYYFGQMQADNYWRQTQNDSAMSSEEARTEYMQGVEAGIRAAKGSDAYNRGLFLGVQLAMNSKEFEEAYDVDLDRELMLGGLANGLRSDTAVRIADAHAAYYKVVDRLNESRQKRDNDAAIIALAKTAERRGLSEVDDNLYAVDITKSNGLPLREGDRVHIEITSATASGHMAGGYFPDIITLGAHRIPDVLRMALYTMTNGQTRQFMTTPMDLFGQRYSRMGLRPDDPIVFTVHAEITPPDAQDSPIDAAVPICVGANARPGERQAARSR